MKLTLIYTTIFLFLTGCKEIDLLKQQNEDLKNQLIELKNSVDQALNELGELKSGQLETQSMNSILHTQLQNLLSQISDLKIQINNSNSDIDKIISELILLQEKCEKLIKQIESLNKINLSLKKDLVLFYPFNGNAVDFGPNNLNGIVNQAELTNDRYGYNNSAYSFSENQDILVPNSESLNTYPLTISLWYLASEISSGDKSNLFSKYVPAAWNGFGIKIGDYSNVGNKGEILNHGFGVMPWYLRSRGDRIIGYYDEDPFLQKFVNINVWYHFVFTVDSTKGSIYLNGKLIDSHPWTGTEGASSNNFPWKIGGYYNTWFKGKIDDVGVWNRVLSEEEINYLYTSTFLP